jgi:Ca2+-binding RTX toxin-like protein
LTGTDTAAEVVVGSSHTDTLVGGSGLGDTVDYSNSTAAVNVNLATNVVSGGYAAGDTISGFENVIGSAFNDTLTAASGSVLDGGANSTGGTDTLIGGAGNDVLIASRAGVDSLTGNGGNDTFVLQGNGAANVTITDFNTSGTDSIVVDVADRNLTISNAALINVATQFNSGTAAPTSGGPAWAENPGGGDKFYYDTTNHNLWFSAGGTGADQHLLAQISTGVSAAVVGAAIHVA